MTATQTRLTRSGPANLLPLALIIILLGVALALAPVAPGRATGGIYQVIVGDGPNRFTIPTESLTCNRNGDVARCTVPVGGHPLAISIHYAGFDSTCTATHGGRMVSCASGLGATGQASHTVWISENLGATEQPAVPWWRQPNGPTRAALILVAGLTIAAALAAFLIGRRPGRDELAVRALAALGIGALGLVLLGASGMIMGQGFDGALLVSPLALIAAIMLGFWQYQLGGLGTGRAKALGAAIAVAAYTATAAYVFLRHGGFA